MSNLQSVKQRFGIIGNSVPLDSALHTAITVAPTDLTVLITGESGVGKEVFSKIIHFLSTRKHNPFIAVNCGAIPEGTINSELFGHTKGAFTGATGDRKGYFETVNGGTIFLDEVGEMPLETQTRLLRLLEQGEFMRVGDSQVQKTDVRVIAATNVDLQDKIRKGKFREDLFYRLSTVPIKVPSLRERREDIYLLFRKFAGDFAEKYHTTSVRLDEHAQRRLEQYPFPGNIRELKNIAEQVSVLAPDKNVSETDLLTFLPKVAQNYLPAVSGAESGDNNAGGGYQEREIMFKFLYDMKKDLNDMKSLIAEMVRVNNLRMPSGLPTTPPAYTNPSSSLNGSYFDEQPDDFAAPNLDTTRPMFIDRNQPNTAVGGNKFHATEEVDDHLSLGDMEKDMIVRALKRHRGRRKDAAAELGISERTLYRKIKDYKIRE